LLDSVEEWFEFHEARNLTSHTYSEKTAEEVYRVAVGFSAQVDVLIGRLRAVLDDEG
jgi:hypothetical protein